MTEVIYPEERLRQKIHIRDPTLRNALSEFIGTALLLFIGIGIVMQFILSGEKLNTWIQINIGWGLAIAFCVYACSKTSGGHLNPAVSIALLTMGRLPVKDFIIYCFAQTFGAFIGTVGAYGIYYDQFIKYAGNHRTIIGPKATAICFCSFPALHVSNTTAFFDQVAGTALLMFFVCVIIDKRIAIPGWVHPFLFGFVVIMIGTSVGMNVGYPINPARDLGPRIFMLFIGYGSQAFTYHDYYFWIPIIAPLVGAVLAAWTYHLFIGCHIPDPKPVVLSMDEAKQPLRSANDV
ncbi:hypothetical protein Y032_0068g217 [Ancylostoma ceylanicum]|uniref:Channel protein, MIP family n=2 Tax=Ancylostoma ceylanicum TaxID=53326 RepID=A0A016TYQ3_9BILA|nr:hypothetical protein Y032_0068g217 [Ancylostoma ceylanicum]